MNKLFNATAFLGIVGILLTGCGGDKTETAAVSQEQTKKAQVLNVGTSVNSQHSLYEGLSKFKELVEGESNQRLQVNLFHSGQMGADRELAEAIKLGTVQAAIISPSALSNFFPEFTVFDLPFLFSSENQVDEFLKGSVGQEILNSGTSKGYTGLSYMELGFRNITNSKREIKSVKDLQDIKIRVTENPLTVDTWNALGAKPTPMAFTELFTALQQGTVDAQENPYGQIAASKFYEVQKYLSKTHHTYNPAPFIIGKKFMDSLSEEDRQIILKAGASAAEHQVKINRKKETASLQLLIDNGMVVTELTPEELNGFRQAVQSVNEKYADKIGKDFMQRVLDAVK
ncbi:MULTISPECIES: TRAP transporter substrate-binding protein [unclassified Paenibacillus]|uniref:TRAP transporter substrate-binding protein n=1 Tax=unclassified Paenibacillus TaxID=185978 RepID=UPI001AEA8C29|nr:MULTISPECIES: TRAP transporter substrate-binding protein [unclassified Paenibacillus]MBP1156738.1 tripartite ATP-independent transporter DctP family solute receptor [Paenibacillus sp. PvP091]MBP1172523.1 tripartite ATP-independent transporter DctP family solute receptor [Paenibacillus sp. PvR098]MBP2438904.1 tripartite ATP-independent transporter DctP family solute receptor [Paenibacillus sp. PvP052]